MCSNNEYNTSSLLNFKLINFAEFLKKVSSHIITVELCLQAGSWAGNLVLKHRNPSFVSDLFTVLEALQAGITVGK